MCGYCIERNLVLNMWRTGEFSSSPGIEDIFCDSYSIPSCQTSCRLN
jgi:hypothetical protein